MRHITYDFGFNLKEKCPVISDSFHFMVIVHDPIGSPKRFQNILIWSFKIKAHQKFQYETYYNDFGFNLKENALLFQAHFTSWL